MRGMYLHAERLLAKAGGSNCKERGITHPWRAGEAGAEGAKGCTSGARKPGETPCGREGGRAIVGTEDMVYTKDRRHRLQIRRSEGS